MVWSLQIVLWSLKYQLFVFFPCYISSSLWMDQSVSESCLEMASYVVLGLLSINLHGFDCRRVKVWLMLYIGHSADLCCAWECCQSCQWTVVNSRSNVLYHIAGLQVCDLLTHRRSLWLYVAEIWSLWCVGATSLPSVRAVIASQEDASR